MDENKQDPDQKSAATSATEQNPDAPEIFFKDVDQNKDRDPTIPIQNNSDQYPDKSGDLFGQVLIFIGVHIIGIILTAAAALFILFGVCLGNRSIDQISWSAVFIGLPALVFLIFFMIIFRTAKKNKMPGLFWGGVVFLGGLLSIGLSYLLSFLSRL